MEIEKEGKYHMKKSNLKKKIWRIFLRYFGILSFVYNLNLVLISDKHLKLLLYKSLLIILTVFV